MGKRLTSFIAIPLIAVGGLFLMGSGAPEALPERDSRGRPIFDHFDKVPMGYESGMAMVSGDFDKDGDLDLIVGAYDGNGSARLYFFENDGTGNFTKKMYPVPEASR